MSWTKEVKTTEQGGYAYAQKSALPKTPRSTLPPAVQRVTGVQTSGRGQCRNFASRKTRWKQKFAIREERELISAKQY